MKISGEITATMRKVRSLIKRVLQKPIKTVDNEFIQWLSFANAGMLDPGNVYAMEHAIKDLPGNQPIVEIGSFCGLSTNVISYLLRKHQRANEIFTADKWVFEGSEDNELGDSGIPHNEFSQFVQGTYMRNVQFFSKKNLPYTIKVFSDDFFDMWSRNETVVDVFGRSVQLGGPISFAYIDGNHTYDATKRDFENTNRFLVKGGYVLLDDTSGATDYGCVEFAKDMEAHPSFELVMKNPNHLFKKR